jgi:acetylornithine deacetylase/succinyl-diaminopimelate desuccinylase-like protein
LEGAGLPTDLDRALVEGLWEEDVLPALADYTTLPCLSPAFDPDWSAHGAIAEAATRLADWVARRPVPGTSVELVEFPGRTPVLLVEADATADDIDQGTVLVYGHFDKQPPQGTWRDGLDPFRAVREGPRLYGRGTADDGYSIFATLVALEALAAAGRRHERVVALIESSEESGSPDLPGHLDRLAGRIGRPDLVICLDSGCLTYDRLWVTTSLRGNLVVTVRAEVLTEGLHSGVAGGIVPSSFRVLRQLLSRLEDEATGEIRLQALHADVPATHDAALRAVAAELPGAVSAELPVVPGLRLAGADEGDRLVARAWHPALALTGMDGVPAGRNAGNVLRPWTAATMSLRLPPSVDAAAAADAVVAALATDPPEGAGVQVEVGTPADGWLAPEPEPWLTAALERASTVAFGRPPSFYGEGGTIPFLSALGRRFPGVQFAATGVLGPQSNAHGPNEFLHLPMAKGLTVAVAELIAAVPGSGDRR